MNAKLTEAIAALTEDEMSQLIGALGRMCRGGKGTCPPCALANALAAAEPEAPTMKAGYRQCGWSEDDPNLGYVISCIHRAEDGSPFCKSHRGHQR